MGAEPEWPYRRSADLRSRQGAAALTGYFDTSAIIKLLINEQGSDIAVDLWTASDLRVSSALIYPESRAAIAAAERAQRLDGPALRQAHASLERLLDHTDLVNVDLTLAREAGELAERHALRGYDAVHLATALALDDPNLVVVTWDHDLSAAARACGHSVAPAFS